MAIHNANGLHPLYRDAPHSRSQGGHAPQNFLKYLVILCFEKWRPKQKYCCSRKIKHFGPHKILSWLRQCAPLGKKSDGMFHEN